MTATVARVLVDARPVDHPTARDRGIGRYTAGLLGGLSRIGAPVTALHGSDAEAELLGRLAPDLDLRPWGPEAVRAHASPSTWYLATQLMLHPPSLDPIPAVVTAARLPVAAVMYDVIPYRHPERYLREPSARALAELRAPLARTVDAMLAISEFSLRTAADELRYPRDRMRCIGAGVDPQFVPRAVREAPWPARFASLAGRPYVVAVTGGDERKNTDGLLRAWSRVEAGPEAPTLVVATAADAPVLRRWHEVAAEAGVSDDVVFTGFVSDDEMVALLQRARLAVLPSFDEGFGLPVLEAAACGTPAICSNTSSLPEVLDEPAAWFDPADPTSIARAVERGLGDEDHRAVLARAAAAAVERFTWERVATDAMSALAELGPRRRRTVVSLARRIALVDAAADAADTADSDPSDPADRSDPSDGDGGPSPAGALAELLRQAPGDPAVDVLADGSRHDRPGGARAPVAAVGRYLKRWDYDDAVVCGDRWPAGPGTARLAAVVPTHLWLGAAATGGAVPADLSGVRSVIVDGADDATALRARHPQGPPILVLAPAVSERGTGRWSPLDRAAALIGWLAAVGDLPADTIRRSPAVDHDGAGRPSIIA